MDIATLIGIIVGAVMVVFGILWGNGVSTLQNFVDVPSIIITIGGSLSGLITSYTPVSYTHLTLPTNSLV